MGEHVGERSNERRGKARARASEHWPRERAMPEGTNEKERNKRQDGELVIPSSPCSFLIGTRHSERIDPGRMRKRVNRGSGVRRACGVAMGPPQLLSRSRQGQRASAGEIEVEGILGRSPYLQSSLSPSPQDEPCLLPLDHRLAPDQPLPPHTYPLPLVPSLNF